MKKLFVIFLVGVFISLIKFSSVAYASDWEQIDNFIKSVKSGGITKVWIQKPVYKELSKEMAKRVFDSILKKGQSNDLLAPQFVDKNGNIIPPPCGKSVDQMRFSFEDSFKNVDVLPDYVYLIFQKKDKSLVGLFLVQGGFDATAFYFFHKYNKPKYNSALNEYCEGEAQQINYNIKDYEELISELKNYSQQP